MKKITMILTALLLSFVLVAPVYAHPSRLVDEADILTDAQEAETVAMLDKLSVECEFDIVIVAVDSLEGEDAEDYADDYFDYNGYGMGENYDGALLLISMDDRQWHISTCGYGIAALSDNDLYYMEEEILPYLSSGDYVEAFENFAWLCAGYVQEAKEAGVVYSETESEGMGIVMAILVSLIAGFLFAFIPMFVMKSKMKSVRVRNEAAEYMDRGSRRITRSHDRFLYHTINRVYTPKQETSSTHTSSSGRSHGGRGGGF